MSHSPKEVPPPEKRQTSRRASAGSHNDPPYPTSHPGQTRPAELPPGPACHFVVWVDQDARIEYADAGTCRALGYSPRELSSLRVWDICPMTEESWPAQWAFIKQHLECTVISELRTRSAGILPVRLQMEYETMGGKEYVLCTGRILEEFKAVSTAVLAEFTGDAIFVLHAGRVVYSNRDSQELFGAPRAQIAGELEEILRDSPLFGERMKRAFEGDETTFHWHSRRTDGARFQIECTLFRIEIEDHVRVLAVAVDASARRKSEHALAQLSGRLLQMQDQERRRIARELHDTTGQNLGALSINLSMLLAAGGLDPRAREALEESIALADASVSEIRAMSYLLHPPLLDEMGLASALRAYCDGYSERTGISVDLEVSAPLPRLPQAIEITLFRIVQEGLANIHRHSGSRTATLRLQHSSDVVELEVADHGRGLPPGILEWDVTRIGIGIAAMRERARQLGGRLIIASSETGTILHVVLPLPATTATI